MKHIHCSIHDLKCWQNIWCERDKSNGRFKMVIEINARIFEWFCICTFALSSSHSTNSMTSIWIKCHLPFACKWHYQEHFAQCIQTKSSGTIRFLVDSKLKVEYLIFLPIIWLGQFGRLACRRWQCISSVYVKKSIVSSLEMNSIQMKYLHENL